ncbi:hypothetical protein [Methylobacterium sp. WSM2598]|uniref:hypothetical protein n=1 Tax=Methylobacterium sp. WSM2598 TaxID=398261 RepID=UPI00036016C2|nr:hypothetical protein [Methylobacterium sp. WSM2598]
MTHAYRLPRSIADRLDAALAGRRNAAAARQLAAWLGRWWSAPRRLLYAFPIDRRALAGREDLGLSEARVRGALAALEEVGFLARYEPDPGKRYQRTAEGLHRRPILFRFGDEYGVAFAQANARAQAARGAAAPARRPVPRPEPRPVVLAPPARPAAPAAARASSQLAQKQPLGGSLLLMGEQNRTEPLSPLDQALERLRRGIGA